MTRACGASRGIERLEVRLVLGLEGVDEGEVEGPGERGITGRERIERRRVDDRDLSVGDPGLTPPAACEIGPRAIRVDRDDRAIGRLAERQPERREPVRGADLDDPAPSSREHRQRPTGVAADDRDVLGLRRRLDRRERRRERLRLRFDPVDIDPTGDPALVILGHVQLLIPAIQHRNRDRRPGSSRPRSTRR